MSMHHQSYLTATGGRNSLKETEGKGGLPPEDDDGNR